MVTIQVDDKLIQTEDVNLILETFKNDPKNVLNADKLIFCMPMTTYRGLNPKSGSKFVSNNGWKFFGFIDAWYTQVYNLFDEIRADIQKQKETKICIIFLTNIFRVF